MTPGTRIISEMPAGVDSPANACFYSTPGAADITTTVAAANTLNAKTVRSTVNIPAGYDVRIIDNVPSNRFRGSTYRVLSSVLNSGSYILTLDRPVLTQFSTGDEIVAWAAGIPRNFILEGNGATFEGTGTRFIEYICTKGYRVSGLNFEPGTGIESIASFDSCGHDNRFIDLFVDAAGSVCENAYLLETQEGSAIERCVARNTQKDGGYLINCESCLLDMETTGCEYGAIIGGEGGDFLGCNNTTVRGRYNGNTVQGIGVIVGSRNTDIDAEARFNPTNVQIGDPAGGTVAGTRIKGIFDNATAIAIGVASATAGTVFGDIDTSNSPVGISTGTADHFFSGKWTHYGTGDNILILAGGRAWVDAIDFAPTVADSFVRVTGAGKLWVDRGRLTAPDDSNLFQLVDTAQITLGAVVGVSGGSFGAGLDIAAGATATVKEETDFSGCNSFFIGAGTLRGRVWRVSATVNLSAIGAGGSTSAVFGSMPFPVGSFVQVTPRAANWGLLTFYPSWAGGTFVVDVVNQTGATGGAAVVFDILATK
jgi:hypothetical protein